jgi:hypothetical protein
LAKLLASPQSLEKGKAPFPASKMQPLASVYETPLLKNGHGLALGQ